MSNPDTRTTREHTFEEIVPRTGLPQRRLVIDDLKSVKLLISADLGTCKMLVREVLDLKRGSVVQLNKLAGEMTDIYLNSLPLARGEVVVIGDSLHVRVGELVGQEKTDDATLSDTMNEEA
ncbi:MAG: FliM/FliN family flagellar motor switch protein [Candidatus Hydrogenedentes bacterium]|nr:FliM/FliN family flagellar motor switch protein [Candidatus Hydrogenedentota bacterium]